MSDDQPGAGLLRRLRREYGFSQQRLADVSGVSARTIRGLETGAIRAPHRSSLAALAAGMQLSAEHEAQLTRAWSSVPPTEDWNALTGRTDTAEFMRRVALHSDQLDAISSTFRLTVGEQRRLLWSDFTFVVRARTDGASRTFYMTADDPSTDVADATIERLHGCQVTGDHLVPDTDLRAFSLEFPGSLRKGQTHVYGYRIGVRAGFREVSSRGRALIPTDGQVQGSRRAEGLFCMQVHFLGEVPARVYQVLSAVPEIHGDTLSVDAAGSATFVLEHAEPGNYGIGWAWD